MPPGARRWLWTLGSMKLALFAVVAIVLLVAGEWLYRTFFRAVDPLTAQVVALAEHFRRTGIPVRPYSVRHGYRHSQVTAAAALEISGFPLPVVVTQCPTESAPEAHFLAVKGSPNLMYPQRNGTLVMDLPMWGDGTEEMAKKVSNAFASFRHGT